MDKRLAKRHKRQVARAKINSKESEPDVRTPEQIQAARDASQAVSGHAGDIAARGSAANFRGGGGKAPGTGSAAKTDA
jgi:hypothetical protein